MELREVTYAAVGLRILAAVVLGGIIGMEREKKNRPAGLRTYMLVCMGACLVMLTNQYVCQVYGTGDPVRLGAQVVSGIGFLGAGTIVVTRRSQIKGLTTAAGLWSAAGVGLALGVGFYEAAFAGSFAIFIVMTLLQRMDTRMHRRSNRVGVYFELSKDTLLGEFLQRAREQGVEVRDIQREGETSPESGVRAYVATFKAQDRRRNYLDMIEAARNIPGVLYVEEL